MESLDRNTTVAGIWRVSRPLRQRRAPRTYRFPIPLIHLRAADGNLYRGVEALTNADELKKRVSEDDVVYLLLHKEASDEIVVSTNLFLPQNNCETPC